MTRPGKCQCVSEIYASYHHPVIAFSTNPDLGHGVNANKTIIGVFGYAVKC